MQSRKVVQWIMKYVLDYVDMPLFSSPSLAQRLVHHAAMNWDVEMLARCSVAEQQYVVIGKIPVFYEAQRVEALVIF